MFPMPGCHVGCNFPGLYSILMTQRECVQVARTMRDIEMEIITLLQLHVVNIAWLCDLDELAMRWDQSNVQSICQEKCECIVAEMLMMNKMGMPVGGCGFQLDNCAFKTWLHLKMLINAQMPLIDSSCTTPVDCEGCIINTSVFPICRPHPNDICSVCRDIEHQFMLIEWWMNMTTCSPITMLHQSLIPTDSSISSLILAKLSTFVVRSNFQHQKQNFAWIQTYCIPTLSKFW